MKEMTKKANVVCPVVDDHATICIYLTSIPILGYAEQPYACTGCHCLDEDVCEFSGSGECEAYLRKLGAEVANEESGGT